jgi:hypothetical protein
MNRLHPILLDPKGDEAGNGTSTPKTPDFDPQVAIREAIAKHGDAERALGYFLRDNRKYRRDNAELKAKLPPEGAVVLQGDDLQAWTEYKALGKAGDLKTALTERDRFRDEAEGLRRAEVHKQAAEVHGYKAAVLERLASQDQLQIEVQDTQVNGKPARIAVVKHEDAKGKPVETPLPEYVSKHWEAFLPALTQESARPRPGTPPRADATGPVPNPSEKPRQLYPANPFS